MNHKTHKSIAKMFFPSVPGYKIDKINSAIDNPSKRMVAIQNTSVFDKNLTDAFGLTKNGGHRKVNHSVEGAVMAAYMVDPKNAPELALIHLMADKMSNFIVDKYGSENRDLFEAMLNKNYYLSRQNTGIKMRKRRKMFY